MTTTILNLDHLKKAGHFGVYADFEGKPKINKTYKVYNDILGVALNTKPTSIFDSPEVFLENCSKSEKRIYNKVLQIARDNNVMVIRYSSLLKQKQEYDIAIYFKMKNIRKAVFMAMLHWTNKAVFSQYSSAYIIGKFFGYPDRDIEARNMGYILPDNYEDLSEKEQHEIWINSDFQKKLKVWRIAYRKGCKESLKEVNKFLNSEIMDEWIKKVPLEHL
jgi:hypothetical protein